MFGPRQKTHSFFKEFFCIYREYKIIYGAPVTLDAIYIAWYSLKAKTSPLFFCECASVSISSEEPQCPQDTQTLTDTLVYFKFVQTVYDYRLQSQYLDFAGKAKPRQFIFLLLLTVFAYVRGHSEMTCAGVDSSHRISMDNFIWQHCSFSAISFFLHRELVVIWLNQKQHI